MFLLIIYVVRSQRAMSMHTIVTQAPIILEGSFRLNENCINLIWNVKILHSVS